MTNQQVMLMLGVGAGLVWLMRSGTASAAAPPAGTVKPSGSNTWDITLPPVTAFPVCPAGQIYDPALQMCMVTQYTAPGTDTGII